MRLFLKSFGLQLCTEDASRLETSLDRLGTWIFIFSIFSRGLKLSATTEYCWLRNSSFVYFRLKFCLGIWFCGNRSSYFLLRITKIESKIVETMLWTSSNSQEERRIFKSIEWGKKKKNYVRMKSGIRKSGKSFEEYPRKPEWRKVFIKYCLLHMHRQAKISSHRKNYILEVSKQRINQKVNK